MHAWTIKANLPICFSRKDDAILNCHIKTASKQEGSLKRHTSLRIGNMLIRKYYEALWSFVVVEFEPEDTHILIVRVKWYQHKETHLLRLVSTQEFWKIQSAITFKL